MAGHGRKRLRFIEPAFGRSPKMRDEHQAGALRDRAADARQCCPDARVFDHSAFLERHVEIDPGEDALVLQVDVDHAQEFHGTASLYFAFMNATVVSSMRLEKPHSLSYQPPTFTSVPSATLVNDASNVQEAGLWL